MITAPGGGLNLSLCSSGGEIELGRGTSMGKQQRLERLISNTVKMAAEKNGFRLPAMLNA
jgi:hypothetical protein